MIDIKGIEANMVANNIKPYEPTHPGVLLKEEIEFRNIIQSHLAKKMGMSYKVLNDILNCRRSLTATTAMLFEAALGISAELLMRMQLQYNLQIAGHDKKLIERLAEIRKIAAAL